MSPGTGAAPITGGDVLHKTDDEALRSLRPIGTNALAAYDAVLSEVVQKGFPPTRENVVLVRALLNFPAGFITTLNTVGALIQEKGDDP